LIALMVGKANAPPPVLFEQAPGSPAFPACPSQK